MELFDIHNMASDINRVAPLFDIINNGELWKWVISIGCFLIGIALYIFLLRANGCLAMILLGIGGGLYLLFYNVFLAELPAMAENVPIYEHYVQLYDSGSYEVVTGAVEDFSALEDCRTFVIDGVEFKIYQQAENSPTVYYSYEKKCAITGTGQNLEIHYIVENGETRILYIKELTN